MRRGELTEFDLLRKSQFTATNSPSSCSAVACWFVVAKALDRVRGAILTRYVYQCVYRSTYVLRFSATHTSGKF